MTNFPHLFQPLDLRHVTLKHRLNFGAHTANMSELGLPGAQHLAYYKARAKGGAAMIVVEPVPVHQTAILTRGNFLVQDDAVIPGFRAITETCKEYGTVMIQQLYHVGQHGDTDNSFAPAWSPSGLPSYHDSDGSHAMREREIEESIEAFRLAALRAKQCGFDGVELFAAYHALIDQFWTPWSNRRDDRWGGSFENRMRFSGEICSRIRQSCGDDFIIGLAVSADPAISVILSLENLQEVLAWHEKLDLIDYITCGAGSYFDFTKLIPSAVYPDKLGADFAQKLKEGATSAIVQCEAHIRTPENANTVVASGQADMVSIVRGQIADPDLANKAQFGDPSDIRPCLSCNQKCWGRRYRDYYISCVINAEAGHEYLWEDQETNRASQVKKILVVGGGPAGLECARVLASRGHQVTLTEAGAKLGGQFRLAGMQPRRAQILDYIEWLERQLMKLQVRIQLNSYMEADEIETFGADEVVIATGSVNDEKGFQKALPAVESLPGHQLSSVMTLQDVMSREKRPHGKILILDDIGHWHCLGTALMLAENGHEVILLTSQPMIGFDMQKTATDWPLRQRLKQAGVKMMTEKAILEFDGGQARILDILDGTEFTLEAQSLVLGTISHSETSLIDELEERGIAYHAIGDCMAPRHVDMAIYEGKALGLSL